MSNPSDFLSQEQAAVARGASVDYHLEILEPWMRDEGITEVCINRPGEVFVERQSLWERHVVRELDYDHLISLGTATARYVNQEISDVRPLLSAVLPNNERIQFVRPPACEHGTVSVTIRKPTFTRRTLKDYNDQGFFKHIRPLSKGLTPDEMALSTMLEAGDYMEFLGRAVQLEKVIVVAGETGSGKTTFMKALTEEIPLDQRIITIEDVPELFLPNHLNHVHLFYPSEAKEEENAPVTAATLLKSCLRMKPNRILLAELRGGETFDFINVCASGHGGSITSLHAGSCDLAFERLALMCLQNRQGRQLPYDVIKRLLHLVVDIVVHVHNDVYLPDIGRHITEIWYRPEIKRSLTKAN